MERQKGDAEPSLYTKHLSSVSRNDRPRDSSMALRTPCKRTIDQPRSFILDPGGNGSFELLANTVLVGSRHILFTSIIEKKKPLDYQDTACIARYKIKKIAFFLSLPTLVF